MAGLWSSIAERASTPNGETAPAAAGERPSSPRVLRELTIEESSRSYHGAPTIGILVTSMAIYRPSPSARGELQPHRIALGSLASSPSISCSETGELLAGLESPEPQPHVITFQCSDGRPVIITGDHKGWVRAWEGDDYRPIFEQNIHGDASRQQLYAYGGPGEGRLRVVALQAWFGPHQAQQALVHVLNGDTGEMLQTLVLEGVMQLIRGYVCSEGHRQRIVVAGSRGEVVVIDPEAGEVVQQMRGEGDKRITALACFESDESPPVPHVVASCESSEENVQVGIECSYAGPGGYLTPRGICTTSCSSAYPRWPCLHYGMTGVGGGNGQAGDHRHDSHLAC
jgi:hypothetical protein